jgi:hypothetical protein
MSITIAIFQEFAEDKKEELLHYLREQDTLSIASSPCTDYKDASRNIKIFFNEESVKQAYVVLSQMQQNVFAEFVTDQLTLKMSGTKDKLIYLPKDRIIMRLL